MAPLDNSAESLNLIFNPLESPIDLHSATSYPIYDLPPHEFPCEPNQFNSDYFLAVLEVLELKMILNLIMSIII